MKILLIIIVGPVIVGPVIVGPVIVGQVGVGEMAVGQVTRIPQIQLITPFINW